MFHSRLNIIFKWLKVVVEFNKMKLGLEYPELNTVILQIKELITNPTILNLLNNPTFNNEPSVLSNKGIIIKTFKEFLDMKKLIEPFCKYMAYIDVWSSIGKWLKEGKEVKERKENFANNRSICNYISESDNPTVARSPNNILV